MKKSLIILLIVYALSSYGAYKMYQKSYYHPEGRWNTLEPEIDDIFFVFFPITNTYIAIDYLCGSWKYREITYERGKTTNFFKPRKTK